MRVENMGKAAYENTSGVIPALQYINMHRKISTGWKHIKMSNRVLRDAVSVLHSSVMSTFSNVLFLLLNIIKLLLNITFIVIK